MEKKIIIKDCKYCPSFQRGDGIVWGEFPPSCSGGTEMKELPFEMGKSPTGRSVFLATYEIPSWCPLEDNLGNKKLSKIYDLMRTYLQTLKVERAHNQTHKIGGKRLVDYYDKAIAEWQEILDTVKKELTK